MNPIKYLIKDLKNKEVQFDVWLQGTVKRTGDDDTIISDLTGQVRVSGCDIKDITIGDYCCVLGVAVSTGELPVIKAAKFIKISTNHQRSWELEVQEAQLLLQGMVTPKLKTTGIY